MGINPLDRRLNLFYYRIRFSISELLEIHGGASVIAKIYGAG